METRRPPKRIMFVCHGNICRSTMADVADPWYTGDFETTYDDVLRGCEALLAWLR